MKVAVYYRKIMGKKGAFTVVGIGGSAGALGAFEKFFQNMPANSGMAFVLVSHLDPTRKGLMPELLQNYTAMKVQQVKDGMKVEPNNIYVIAPNRDLALLNGRLQLLEPQAPRGLRLPIDFFLHSLAQDKGQKAIGVILSGMGSDGTLGVGAIKAKLGLALAQDPATTEFDSMPKNAIATGLVDFILPAADLAKKIVEYVKFPQILKTKPIPSLAIATTNTALQKIYFLLREQTGHDFSYYKESTVFRRLERRMNINQIKDIRRYGRYLEQTPAEQELLFKELLIGVTNFFRDPQAFAILKSQMLPDLLKAKPGGGQIRVWVVGCSTGEEVYSLAMVIQEALQSLRQKQIKLQIFATDINKEAIDKARAGIYPVNIASDVSSKRLEHFFIRHNNHYAIKREIRETVIFSVHNVTHDPPFTKLDILCCRNLLIYLRVELQKKLIPLFHYALNPGGILFLGSAESLGGLGRIFLPVNNKWKIFRRKESTFVYPPLPILALDRLRQKTKRAPGAATLGAGERMALPEIAKNVLLENYAPAFVVIDKNCQLLYFGGRTGKYLEPAPGAVATNIINMAREGLGFNLNSLIRQAISQKKPVTAKGLKVKTNGGYQTINLTVRPFREPESMRGLLMVVFEEAGPLKQLEAKEIKKGLTPKKYAFIQELQKELSYTKEQLQSTTEEMESAIEELRSANEELQSTNEELQSSNEEMVTSKEEMQSLNEELTTVNSELEAKMQDLAKLNNDIRNLYDSMEVATIFLDNNLCIRGFSPQATKIINLIPTDVGRPITHIVSNLKHEILAEDIRAVIGAEASKEMQVQTKDEQSYRMCILPYRTSGNVIDGVVVTFFDITAHVKLEQELESLYVYSENIINTVRQPLVVLDADLKVTSANRSFYSVFQISSEETVGKIIYDLADGQWNIPELRRLLEGILPYNKAFNDFPVEHDFLGLGRRKMLLNARRVFNQKTKSELILLAIDIEPVTAGG